MSKYFEIVGGKELSGKVTISGAKNSVLALMIATLLSEKPMTIENVPDISDVYNVVRILEYLGSNVIVTSHSNSKIVTTDNSKVEYKDLHIEDVKKFRASYYLMGAMLGKYSRCNLLLPGGCFLGPRPIDLHLKCFAKMGCEIKQYQKDGEDVIELIAPEGGLRGEQIFLDFPSVGATINVILAAVLANGETVIENAAKEPEIIDLVIMLNNMGADIKGAGTDEIRITGVKELHGSLHQAVPDRIEAGTYLMIGSVLADKLIVDNVIPEHLEAITAKLSDMGANLTIENDRIIIEKAKDSLKAANVKVGVYPSFATDLQQVMSVLMTQVQGESTILETIFPDRFRQCQYLSAMGADIKIARSESTGKAKITGTTPLSGQEVYATDLRAGASLIFAGLIADGTTKVQNIEHIIRGYDSIEQKLTKIGADIRLIEEGEEK